MVQAFNLWQAHPAIRDLEFVPRPAGVAARRVQLVVWADDDPHDLDAPRGKQEWLDTAQAIW